MRNLHVRAVLLLGAVVIGAGCQDDLGPSGPASRAAVSAPPLLQVQGTVQTPRGEHPSARLARLVPGFGGAFIDPTGTLIVWARDLRAGGAARDAVAAEMQRRGRNMSRIQFVQAKFGFEQLEHWQNSIVSTPGLDGLVFFEIDELNNRLRLGVSSPAHQQVISERLVNAGIPRDAMTFVIAQAPVEYQTLQQTVRPLRGGTQITGLWQQTGYSGNQTSICTYGPNVLYNGRRHMIVNSHCTQNGNLGGLVGVAFHQPVIASGGTSNANRYGTEVQDPAFTSGLWGCPAGKTCRYSDAALIEITNSNMAWDHGGISRTVGGPQGLPTVYASLTIDQANPRIGLAGKMTELLVGDVVEKVGRTTGWTSGVVTSTCQHVTFSPTDPHYRLCSGVVSGGAGKGDSGSPVFFRASNGEFYLAGLLYGGNPNLDGTAGDNYYFSNWYYVDYELGTVTQDLAVVP
jgi:hypothetical protein